jgi:hypothetical protein
MAFKLLIADATLSTSAGSWQTAGAALITHLHSSPMATQSTLVTSTTPLYTPVCNVTAGSISDGCVLFLSRKSLLYGINVTITLEEGNLPTGSTIWTPRANSTTTVLSCTAGVGTLGEYFKKFTWANAQTMTANQFRIKVLGDATTSSVYLRRNSSTNTFSYALLTNTSSAKPASTDTWMLNPGTTLTMDENITCAAGTNTAAFYFGIDEPYGATLNIPNPSTTITFSTGASYAEFSQHGSVLCGSPTTPIAAGRLIFYTSNNSIAIFNPCGTGVNAANMGPQPAGGDGKIEFYGASTKTNTFLTESYISGLTIASTPISVSDDMTGIWSVGDNVKIGAWGDSHTTADGVAYVIGSITSTTITFSNAGVFPKSMVKNGALINVSKTSTFGITCASGLFSSYGSVNYIKIDGYCNTGYTFNIPTGVSSTPTKLKNIYVTGSANFVLTGVGGEIEDSSFQPSGAYTTFYLSGTCNKFNIINVAIKDSYTNVAGVFSGNNHTINRFSFSYSGSAFTLTVLSGQAQTFNDCFFGGGNATASTSISAIASTFNRCKFSGDTPILYNGFKNIFNYCDFQYEGASVSTYNMTTTAGNLVTSMFNYCRIGSAGISDNVDNDAIGTAIRFHNFNQIANDHRAWYMGSRFISTGPGLSDTTVNNSTYALRQESHLADQEAFNKYTIISGAISGNKVRISFKGVKIGSANFYSGTYSLPTLTLDYDYAGATASQVGSATINWQEIAKVIIPSLDYSLIYATLAWTTDQITGSDSFVYYDSIRVVERKYGYVYTDESKFTSETTDDAVISVPTLQPNIYINQPMIAIVAAYSGIAIDHTAKKITITTAHLSSEIYDYSQYDVQIDTNLQTGYAEWFKTVDGVNFTSDYDIEINGVIVDGTDKIWKLGANTIFYNGGYFTGLINGNIVLHGSAVYNLKLISNTVTFSEAGAYDLSGSNITGTIVLTNTSGGVVTVNLNPAVTFTNSGPNITVVQAAAITISALNIITGSTVYIYNETTSQVLYNGVVNATFKTISATYLGSADVITVRVRKYGYKPVQTATVLSSSNVSVFITQIADSIVI